MAADMGTDARSRSLFCFRCLSGALAAWSVLMVCAIGCAHQTNVRYQVHLDSSEARLCARLCSQRYPTERGSYARCLGTCPGAVEQDDAKCPPADAKGR